MRFFRIFHPCLDLPAKNRLIIVDSKNIMTLFLTDYPAGILPAVQSVGRDDTALQFHLLKILLCRRYLIGLFRYGDTFQIKVHTGIVCVQGADIDA